MPPSRQVRARQNRQKERIAEARVERQRTQHKRRVVGSFIGALVLIGVIVAAVVFLPSSNSSDQTSGTTPETTPAVKCVKVADKLPAGAPAVPVEVGPAPTKLVIKDLKAGTGPVIPKGATISANYVGVTCTTGKSFDSSYAHGGKPIQFSLTQVIPGWTDGIPGMKVGGTRLLGIPAEQAYGSNPPQGSGIPPEEPLWFVVQPTQMTPASATTTTVATG